MLDDVRRLAEIENDAERARAASKLLAELQTSISETSRLRRESIARLREQGHSLAQIADLIGVSRARIAQLREAGPPPERAFLGFDTLTVALPLKRESQYGRPAVAQEDFAAFNALALLARDLQLGAEVEYIQLGGTVDLNRDNLVVICGPRISPLIAEVLKNDPVLQFEFDDSGWFLTDQRTGQTYRSPSDDPAQPPGDVAYLSRQSRPDGNGSFILLTGIHAVGSSGVIHYLTRELADLYEQIGTQRFSTLIASDYDRPPAPLRTAAESLPSTYTRTPDTMQVAFATQPAADGALNEDFIAATTQLVILLDGASVPEGLETGCRHGTAWYVARLGTRLLEELTAQPSQLLTDALATAIHGVASLHADTCELDHPGAPSAALALLREGDQTVDYLVLADTTIVLDATSDFLVVSDDRLTQVAVTEHSAMHREATGTVSHQQRYADLVTELRRHRNQAEGYWVASNTPDAAYQALTGSIPRLEVRRAALLSDGATRLADRFGVMAWPRVFDLLDREGPSSLIMQTREAESSDPNGRRWPRSKRHDDASAVICRFGWDS